MNNKGFTLVELLVTIALLAIISTIAIVSINSFIKKTKKNNCNTLKNTFIESAKDYVSDNRYGTIKSTITAQELYNSHYIKNDVEDPYTGESLDLSKIIITITYTNKNYRYSINMDCGDTTLTIG